MAAKGKGGNNKPAAKKVAPNKGGKGDGKKLTHCEAKAAHRKAQNKYVAKDPNAQAKRVAKSQQKQGSGKSAAKSGSQAKGAGQHGHSKGRPRKAC